MRSAKILLLISASAFVCCEETINPLESLIDVALLCQEWTHSLEEQNSEESAKIFRPNAYKEFPAIRYREQLSFSQDGKCRYLVLAPNDAHYFQEGTWAFVDRPQNIIKILDPIGHLYKKLQIIELTPDLLKLVLVE